MGFTFSHLQKPSHDCEPSTNNLTRCHICFRTIETFDYAVSQRTISRVLARYEREQTKKHLAEQTKKDLADDE